MHGLLRDLGLNVNCEPADLVVAVTDTYLTSSSLDKVVQDRLQDGIPCLILQPSGVLSLAGPLLRPGGVCWDCLRKTMSRHHPAPQEIQKLNQTDDKVAAPLAYLPPTLHQVYAFAAQAVAHYVLHGCVPQLEQHLISFDSATLLQECHKIVPWVFCAACLAKQETSLPQPLVLPFDQRLDTIEAAATAELREDSLKLLQQITSPYTGVLTTQHLKQDPEAEGSFYWAIFTHPFYNSPLPGHYGSATHSQRAAV